MSGIPRTTGILLYPVYSQCLVRTLLVYIAVTNPAEEGGGKIALVPTRNAGKAFLRPYGQLPGYDKATGDLQNEEVFQGVPEGTDHDLPEVIFNRNEEDKANKFATKYIQVALHGPSGRPAPDSSPDD